MRDHLGTRLVLIPASIWDREDMKQALANRDISTMYRILNRHGVSQRVIADIAGQSQSEVSEILKGRRVITYVTLERICEAFNIPRSRMGLAYTHNSAPATVKQDAPSLMELAWKAIIPDQAVADRIEFFAEPTPVVGKVSMTDVDAMEDAFQAIQKLDQQFGGSAQYLTAIALIEQCKNMLRGTMSDVVRIKLARKVGWIHSFAGWTAIDSGERNNSLYHFAQALKVSQETNDLLGRSRALYQSARAEQQLGNNEQALKLLQLCTLPAAEIRSNAFLATCHAQMALACSNTDHASHADRYAKQSKEFYSGIKPDDEQGDILKYIQMPDLLSATGMAYATVNKPEIAINELEQGLKLRNSISTRSQAFEYASLSYAYLLSGARDEGEKYGQTALQLAQQIRSSRTATRFKPMLNMAAKYKIDLN